MEENCKITNLHYCHGNYFIWDAQDAIDVREKFRVIGTCNGCFPGKPRQNSQLSLPLLLSKIEAKFLLDYHKCILLNSSAALQSIDFGPRRESTRANRVTLHKIQTKLKQTQKWNDLDCISEKIKEGKIKKGLKKAVECSSTSKIAEPDDQLEKNLPDLNEGIFSKNDFEKFKLNEVKKIEQHGLDQTWVYMPIKSELEIPYPVMETSVVTLSEEERLKYTVFCDLHKQGYYLTDGVKFGGHFLVYPGDPGIYHSEFIVFCVPFYQKLTVNDYSALGRLATSVKKSLLLCSVDENDHVVYSSFAWSGLV